MGRYIASRLLLTVFVLFGVSVIVFAMIRLIPGDPAELLADQWATKEDIELLRAQWGLDEPIPVQYVIFITKLFRGDLGNSVASNTSVIEEIAAKYPNTLKLAIAGTLIAILIGVPAGTLSAVKPYSSFDHAAMVFSLLGVSTPAFWLGLIFLLVFAVQLHWLPAGGSETFKHLILPSVTLGLLTTGIIARQTRSSMLEVMGQDYVLAARAKGLVEFVVINKHALKNALIPIVTIVGLQFGRLLGGTVLVESVFSWPGMGRLLIDAIFVRDYPVIQGAVLVFASTFCMVNLGVDLLYGYLDPRIRYG